MDMSQYKDLFVSEALEHLQLLNQKLVELEQNPASDEALEQIFRSAHTVKGMAATMGYTALSQLAHALEDLLDRVRRGEQTVTSPLIDLLFTGVDSMSALVDDVAADRGSELDVRVLIDRLRGAVLAKVETTEPVIQTVAPPPPDVVQVRVTLADDCLAQSLRAYMILERLRDFGQVVGTEPSEEVLASENFDTMRVYLRSDVSPDQVQAAVEGISEVESVQVLLPKDKSTAGKAKATEAAPPAEPERPIKPATQTAMVRVNIGHLDLLLNLVSELVISRGQLLEATRSLEAVARQHGCDRELFGPLSESLEHHDRTLGRLHKAVLQARMVPMSQVFDRFPRMMRDLLRDLGKEAEFEMVGRDVEMDRAALEALGDPLVHLLRNATDHGLGTPEERRRAGKSPQGLIRLSARRERGQAIIEVQDDGRGMDADQILETAIQRGVVARERSHELDRHQILMLVCDPGFSTAKQVTGVSGRGVGMDVVRRQVESLRGSMEIETTPGEGTIFRLLLPLSLSLTQALLIKVAGETFAVPLHHIEYTIEVEPERVQRIHRWQVLRLEDGVLPIFPLRRLLNLPNGNKGSDDTHALVVRRGDQRLGLVVNDLIGKEEIVVKPLPKNLTDIPGLSGTTIVGAGQVVLILDVPGLVQGLV